MNLKTTSAKLMSIILTIVMLVGMMPATMAMAEDPIYSIEAEDIELYLPAGYNQNDIYNLSKAEIHGKDLRTIKIKNTGNQSVHIYRDKPTLTDRSENFPDDNDYKIFVNYSSSNAYSTVNPGETKSYYYIEIDTGLAPGVYTATINIAAQTREENLDFQPGSLKVTANFKLTVGDHNWDTTSWEKNTQKHWHKCTDSGCTAKKDEAEHDSAKVVGYVAPNFDNDGSTGDKYCSVCDQKVANATPIAAGKYIRESRATMTPAAISDAICANDLVFTSAEPDKYTVALWEERVYDLTDNSQNTYNPGGGERYPSDKNFIAGHQYRIEFEFTAVEPYVYDGKGNTAYWTTFTLNGESTGLSSATTIGNSPLRSITLTATASGGAPTHAHAWAEAWSKDSTHHWHDCTATGCDLTANNGKAGYAAHVYDNDADTTCNTCGYVRTTTPTTTQVTGAKFALNGYAIGSKIVDITVTPDSTNTGINYGGDMYNKYHGYYGIFTDAKVLDGDFDSAVEAGSTAAFVKDTNYYLLIQFIANEGYSIDDLTAAQVTLDGVGAASVINKDGSMVTAVFTLPQLKESSTDATLYDLWIAGERFTSEKLTINCGSGTATLTLLPIP